jgi:hypothetical protein
MRRVGTWIYSIISLSVSETANEIYVTFLISLLRVTLLESILDGIHDIDIDTNVKF